MTDKQLVRLVRQFRAGLLGTRDSALMCAVVCYPLAGYLGALGVPVTVREGHPEGGNHVWLALPDGRVLDPTLDQFLPSMGPVYLGPPMRDYHPALAHQPDDARPAGGPWTSRGRCGPARSNR